MVKVSEAHQQPVCMHTENICSFVRFLSFLSCETDNVFCSAHSESMLEKTCHMLPVNFHCVGGDQIYCCGQADSTATLQ